MLYIVCWLHKQYGLFWRLSIAGAFFAMLLRLSCPLNQPSPPIHLPIRPPARTVVARRQEVFEPAILFGSMRLRWWLGGWAGGGGRKSTLQAPLWNKKQAALQCKASWERELQHAFVISD